MSAQDSTDDRGSWFRFAGQANSALLYVCVALAYFASGKLGLIFATLQPSATTIWPPTGLALASLLILGYRIWPAIFVAAFFVNLTTAGNALTSLFIAGGNTLEGLVGTYLVNQFASGARAMEKVRDVFRFILGAAFGATTISATVGALTLVLSGMAKWQDYGSVWMTWWLGDTVGALVVAPAILIWSRKPARPSRTELLEGAALILYLFLVSHVVFGDSFAFSTERLPISFLCIPFLVWAAARFTPHVTTAAILVLTGVGLNGTFNGYGPFVRETEHGSLLFLLSFLGVMAGMTLTLMAAVAERKRFEEEVAHLASTDPLTGLANYRKFIEVGEAEIARSDRTGRPFALVILDMDGLKRINDQFGHLVGSRALCRLANILSEHCRTSDTSARYGGDEFALLLPETGIETARKITQRLRERLVADTEEPRLSASMGIAIFPKDGNSLRDLFRSADGALYNMKNTHHRRTDTRAIFSE